MPSDPMTAEALHALVSQWPQEARDKDLVFNPANKYGESLGWECEGEFIIDRHAIALHEASGIKWLIDHSTSFHTMRTSKGAIAIELFPLNSSGGDWTVFAAPTLIEAIHAAIMATAKEEA
jgi:hypothetical protein